MHPDIPSDIIAAFIATGLFRIAVIAYESKKWVIFFINQCLFSEKSLAGRIPYL
jgi:hypothetical protein